MLNLLRLDEHFCTGGLVVAVTVSVAHVERATVPGDPVVSRWFLFNYLNVKDNGRTIPMTLCPVPYHVYVVP